MKRDGALSSIWQSCQGDYQSAGLTASTVFDVIIVGAGITGVTTALLLQKAGKSCLLAEAVTAGFGTTGGTTAHLNTFYDTPYYQMIKDFGEEHARLVAKGAKDAIGLIEQNIAEYSIDCAFEKDAFLFALDEKQVEELDKIVEASNELEVPMEFLDDNPFPIQHLKLARVADQAQFNPMQYLFGLLKAFEAAGGIIAENCLVQEVTTGEILAIDTSLGKVQARNLVYATHIPPGVNLIHFRCAPYRSYALGLKLKSGEDYPDALGYDLMEPYHYYRTQEIDGEKYLIAGGEDHKTGHHENTDDCFRKLESYVRAHFNITSIPFRWSSQYYEPTDGLPYIGNLPGSADNMYVATGYSGNGMIYGTLSGIVLADLIVKGSSGYKEVFNPKRLKPIAGFNNFVKEAADVVKELVTSIFPPHRLTELSSLAKGEAKLVKYEGHAMGIYRDENGKLHAINSACTHIKCSVKWNSAEKSWDCPCHGSRFSVDGNLLTAPAVKNLQQVELNKEIGA